MDKIVVAVVQAGSALFDVQRTLDKVELYCGEAARAGAKLVLFPEAFLGGYPKGITFGAHVGSRSDEGREQFRRYYEAAVEIPGDELICLGKVAQRHRIQLVIGVIERAAGTLYCSVLFLGPDGSFQGKHRKLMPTALERLIWGFGDGSTMPAIQTEYGIVGAAICCGRGPMFRVERVPIPAALRLPEQLSPDARRNSLDGVDQGRKRHCVTNGPNIGRASARPRRRADCGVGPERSRPRQI